MSVYVNSSIYVNAIIYIAVDAPLIKMGQEQRQFMYEIPALSACILKEHAYTCKLTKRLILVQNGLRKQLFKFTCRNILTVLISSPSTTITILERKKINTSIKTE